jgi:hypothetical protein
MEKYVVTYSEYGRNTLTDDYETIEGKTPINALEKRFNRKFKRVTGDAGRHANVIISKGYYNKESNNIYFEGKKFTRLCYVEIT